MICNVFSSYDFGAVTNKKCNLYNKKLERREIELNKDFKFKVPSSAHHDYLLNLSMSKKPESHPYNCSCNDCVRKHGNLPLLVQVIEGREKYQASSKASTSSYSSYKSGTSTSSYGGFNSGASTSSDTAKNIICPHCNKSFSHRGDYNKHLRTHTGEQPFTCSICSRKFAHTSNLNRHIRVHTGDRPYLCDVCNKNFNRKDKLDMHKKTKLCKNTSEKYSSSSK